MDPIQQLAKLIKSRSKIVFLNGAGISTACGIPDFRSPGTGLYDNLSKLNLPYLELVFDIDYFKQDPKLFYLLAKDIYPGQYKPSKCHYFISHLHAKHDKLHRCYTQNIDTLERLAGLPDDKIVELHGSFNGNHCIECGAEMSNKEMEKHILQLTIAKCSKCRSYVKPDIVFFGELLPEKFWKSWEEDAEQVDLLIVCGTSLQVFPFAGLPIEVDEDKCVRVLINKEICGDFKDNPRDDDIVILGDIDEIIEKLAGALEWEDQFEEELKKADQLFTEKKLKLKVEQVGEDLGESSEEESGFHTPKESLQESEAEAQEIKTESEPEPKPEPKPEPEVDDLDKQLDKLKIDKE